MPTQSAAATPAVGTPSMAPAMPDSPSSVNNSVNTTINKPRLSAIPIAFASGQRHSADNNTSPAGDNNPPVTPTPPVGANPPIRPLFRGIPMTTLEPPPKLTISPNPFYR